MENVKCTKCNRVLDSESRFCPDCGSEITQNSTDKVNENINDDICNCCDSVPLRADNKKGMVLITTSYKDMKITVKRSALKTILIIKGNVYAEKIVSKLIYTLEANVQGNNIQAKVNRITGMIYLYANEKEILKKLCLFQ